MLLAVDTATRYASAALYDERGVISERSWLSQNNHSVEVMPAIADMLWQQQLAPSALVGIAVAKGPGSFTGLRIGMSIAKGLCLALSIPILGIPTLDVTAYAAGDPGGRVVAVVEAGRGRLCLATYHFEGGRPVQEGPMELVEASRWTLRAEEPLLVAGEVSPRLAERLLSGPHSGNIGIRRLAGSLRRAGYLAELAWDRLSEGEVDDLDSLSPIYAHQPLSGTLSD